MVLCLCIESKFSLQPFDVIIHNWTIISLRGSLALNSKGLLLGRSEVPLSGLQIFCVQIN
jgi:hypothetical protein